MALSERERAVLDRLELEFSSSDDNDDDDTPADRLRTSWYHRSQNTREEATTPPAGHRRFRRLRRLQLRWQRLPRPTKRLIGLGLGVLGAVLTLGLVTTSAVAAFCFGVMPMGLGLMIIVSQPRIRPGWRQRLSRWFNPPHP